MSLSLRPIEEPGENSRGVTREARGEELSGP